MNRRLVALLPLGFAAACARQEYVRVRSTLTVNVRAGDSAEVVAGRDLDRARGVSRVAVSAPDGCVNFTSVEEGGVATEASNVIRQRCAVELATLERSLASAGYSVISWRQLRDLVTASRDSDASNHALSTLQAARSLGAQALIDVNSLDWITRARPPIDARWDRALHASNAYGQLGEALTPERFTAESLSQIERSVNAAEDDVVQQTRRGAGLNVTLLSTEAGQALLFYRRIVVQPYQSRDVVNVLLARSSDGYRVVPPEEEPAQARTLVAFRPSVAVSYAGRADAHDVEVHYQLLQELVNDFVAQVTSRVGLSDARRTEARREDGRREDGRREDGRREDGRREDGRREEPVASEAAPAAPPASAPPPAAAPPPAPAAASPPAPDEEPGPPAGRRRRHRRD